MHGGSVKLEQSQKYYTIIVKTYYTEAYSDTAHNHSHAFCDTPRGEGPPWSSGSALD